MPASTPPMGSRLVPWFKNPRCPLLAAATATKARHTRRAQHTRRSAAGTCLASAPRTSPQVRQKTYMIGRDQSMLCARCRHSLQVVAALQVPLAYLSSLYVCIIGMLRHRVISRAGPVRQCCLVHPAKPGPAPPHAHPAHKAAAHEHQACILPAVRSNSQVQTGPLHIPTSCSVPAHTS